jgi:hypothetical protein
MCSVFSDVKISRQVLWGQMIYFCQLLEIRIVNLPSESRQLKGLEHLKFFPFKPSRTGGPAHDTVVILSHPGKLRKNI